MGWEGGEGGGGKGGGGVGEGAEGNVGEGWGRGGRGREWVMVLRLDIALSQPTHSACVVGAGPQDLRHLLLPNDLQRVQDTACQGQTDKRHTPLIPNSAAHRIH